MSPLIHKSLTWAIVSTVVLMAAWLASSVQDAHDQRGFKLRLVEQGAVPASASGADVAAAAAAYRAMPPIAQAHLQGASVKR